MLHIRLLGGLYIAKDDTPVSGLHLPRLQALIAYLLLHRQRPQSRHQLAFRFWPDSNEKQAHTNLRKLLFQLRNALPNSDRFLRQNHLTVQWRPDAACSLDVAELQESLRQSQKRDDAEALKRVVQLYQGELLPSCFDEWILPIRQQLQREVMGALEQLINLHEHQREYQASIHYAQRLLGIDPLHEAGYRRMMQLHALNGERSAALQAYQACADVLRRELDVEPDEETHALHQRILAQENPTVYAAAKPHFDTPLIGRVREWRILLTHWRQSQQGRAHCVSITGEAGIGKTRLAEEMIAWANAQGIRVARTRSYEAEGGLAYAPATDWLRSPVIKATLKKLDKVWLSEVARLLPELLSEHANLTPPAPLSEAWQRQRFFEALARAILLDKSALLLVIDDLQWCDSETLTWLRFLLRFEPQARLLIVGTWRTEAVDELHPLQIVLRDLANTNQLTTLELTVLTIEETAELAEQVANRPITSSEIKQLYAVTEGYPLFVVETVRARGEDHAQSLPPKVQTIIQTRLTQLSADAREVVSIAATMGRHFSLAVITHICQIQEESLVRALDELWQRRIVRELGSGDYDFMHDLMREVAYQSLSSVRRRFLHRRVAEALEQVFARELGKVSRQLAAHFEAASLPDRALTYYQEAATTAFQIYALHEAHSFCQQGLRLINQHPSLRTDVTGELKLLVMLTAVAVGIQGYGVEEVKGYYERALHLSAQTEPGEWIVSIYYGLWLFHFVSAEFEQADQLTEQMPAQAQRLNDPFLLELAHHGRGLTHLYRGEAASALVQLTRSLHFAQSRAAVGETFQQSQSLTIMTYAFRALALWLHGYPEQAIITSQESLRRQAAQPTPLNQAASLMVASVLHIFTRDKAMALGYAERALAISAQYDLAYWRLFATTTYLWASLDKSSNPQQEIEKYAQLLEQIIQSGNHVCLAYTYHLLVEMQAQSGKREAAIATLRNSLAQGEKTGERWWEAENYRYLGELLLQTEQVEEAVACLQKALVISQAQGAKSFELRAAISLARLRHGQNKTKEAHTLLAPIYGWFTEGFETPDLVEAKVLLDTLTAINATSHF